MAARRQFTILTLLLAAATAASAQDQERPLDGHWRLGARAFFNVGYGGGLVDTAPGVSVEVGRALSPRDILFLNVDYGQETLKDGSDDRTTKTIAATYQRWFNRRNGVSPYWLTSLGGVRSDNNNESVSGPVLAVGFGASLPTALGELYGELRSTHRFYRDPLNTNNSRARTENLFGLSVGLLWDIQRHEVIPDAPPPTTFEPIPEPPVVEEVVAVGPYIVYFDFDRSNLDADDRRVLDEAIRHFRFGAGAGEQITVTGNTDSKGSDNYNLRLSARRARQVRDYMIDQGIPASRINIIAAGESDPVADNRTEAGRAENRRTTVQSKEDLRQ